MTMEGSWSYQSMGWRAEKLHSYSGGQRRKRLGGLCYAVEEGSKFF